MSTLGCQYVFLLALILVVDRCFLYRQTACIIPCTSVDGPNSWCAGVSSFLDDRSSGNAIGRRSPLFEPSRYDNLRKHGGRRSKPRIFDSKETSTIGYEGEAPTLSGVSHLTAEDWPCCSFGAYILYLHLFVHQPAFRQSDPPCVF